MAILAINGGTPVINDARVRSFPQIGDDDVCAVAQALRDGILSGFRAGTRHGGRVVCDFERHVSLDYRMRYAVSFDTWSNGIIACLLSLGVRVGDEVIVSPYTMSSCAASIIACGAVPVFADVCRDSGCIDPIDVNRKITSRTRVIMVVHLFGIPADLGPLLDIAKRHGIALMEDCAQAPMASYRGQLVGTFGIVGGFSFTATKHVTSGEGGIAVTNDREIDDSLRAIRNHGEVIDATVSVGSAQRDSLIGFNFRMTELVAALALSQWKKLDDVIMMRRALANRLIANLSDASFLRPLLPSYEHVPSWYQLPFVFDSSIIGISRERFIDAVNAEGCCFSCGYVKPIYKQQMYVDKSHWVLREYGQHVDYRSPECPVVERLWSSDLVSTLDVRPPYDFRDMDMIATAIWKVAKNVDELRG